MRYADISIYLEMKECILILSYYILPAALETEPGILNGDF